MTFSPRPGCSIRPAGRRVLPGLLILFAALALAACAVTTPGAVPTLVPTLALLPPSRPTHSPTAAELAAVSLTPMPFTETPAPPPTDTQTLPPTPEDTITPGPSPTASRTPTITRIPTRTKSPTRTPTITLTPTVTFTPTPPGPALYLARPGLLSKVVSPIQAELYAVTGGDAKVDVELIGEDGQVLARQVQDYQRPGRYIWQAPNIPFEINAAAETARLQVVTHDEFGRVQGLTSTDLVLLSVGRNEINPPAITQEPYLIRQPDEDAQIFGGLLNIDGLARPVNDSPLIIELITQNGTAMSTKQLLIDPPTGDLSHTPFSVSIPYKVSGPTPVRLTLRQEGSRIPGTVALVSETIVLNP